MKKSDHWIPIAITAVFAMIIFGIILYRQINPTTISLSDSSQITAQKDSPIQNGKININKASEDELMLIPGIGKTLATRIVDYRKQHGLFLHLEDLKNVSGIGNTRFETISEYITIDP